MLEHGLNCRHVPTTLKETITNSLEAAAYIAREGTDQGFRNYINYFLDNSPEFKSWRKSMPPSTPPTISKYRNEFLKCDIDEVSNEINKIGLTLTQGQFLFHGGVWTSTSSLITNIPLSTSFCPDVALRNAEHRGKAYDAGRIDLVALEVAAPRTNVFVFKRNGTTLGYENEVLFAAGAEITFNSCNLISNNYKVFKFKSPQKEIPISVIHAYIS